MYRRAQDANALVGEHGTKNAGELAAAVPIKNLSCTVTEVHQKIPRLLGHPAAAG